MRRSATQYIIQRVGHLILHHTPVSLREHVLRLFVDATDMIIEDGPDKDIYQVVVKLAFNDEWLHTLDFTLGEFDGVTEYDSFMHQVAQGFGHLRLMTDTTETTPLSSHGSNFDPPFNMLEQKYIHFYVSRKNGINLVTEDHEELHFKTGVVVPSK